MYLIYLGQKWLFRYWTTRLRHFLSILFIIGGQNRFIPVNFSRKKLNSWPLIAHMIWAIWYVAYNKCLRTWINLGFSVFCYRWSDIAAWNRCRIADLGQCWKGLQFTFPIFGKLSTLTHTHRPDLIATWWDVMLVT